jgi:hypothetical protein
MGKVIEMLYGSDRVLITISVNYILLNPFIGPDPACSVFPLQRRGGTRWLLVGKPPFLHSFYLSSS